MARAATGQIIELRRKHGLVFGMRYRVNGKRYYETTSARTRAEAEQELAATFRDVRLGTWRPPRQAPVVELPREEPTFHVAASEWVAERRLELAPRSIEALEWALSHVLEYFAEYMPSAITASMVDAYKRAKLQESRLSKR